ncbi:hypothetical protein Hdeb2414_s0009g00326121 [Helianthus debilis subsp. tardiflorus]
MKTERNDTRVDPWCGDHKLTFIRKLQRKCNALNIQSCQSRNRMLEMTCFKPKVNVQSQDNKIEIKINQVHSLFACHPRIQSLAFGSYATLHV